jgi:hypothetical protein
VNLTELNDMCKKDNQKKFLNAYTESYGNITKACEAAGISRGIYYQWTANPEFVAQLAAIEPEERFVDFCEGALAKKVSSGDTIAIIFALKTKGKKRGYVEKTESEITVNRVEVEFI